MVAGKHRNVRTSVKRHDAATVTNIDHVGSIIDNHDDRRAGARSLRADLLTWHGVLSTALGLLNKVNEVLLALIKACADSLLWVLREVLVLDNEVMQVVSQVVRTGCSTVAIEDSKEANLRPLDI